MAAREHQGLQIALIIFVMLTIVLSVTTFMFFSNYDEEKTKSDRFLADKRQAETVMKTQLDEANEFRRIIGADPKADLKAVVDQFDKDMATHGGTFPDNEKNYRHLIEHLLAQYQIISKQITDRDARETELQNKITSDETAKKTEIKTYVASVDKHDADLKAERERFNQDREKHKADGVAIAQQLEEKRKEQEDIAKRNNDEITRLAGELTKLLDTNKKLVGRIEGDVKIVAQADGKVTWVNQKTRTVWLNQGAADGLIRQTSFSVIAANENNPAQAPKKAKIEVTSIQGPHLAEARIVEDNIRDPIMPGDQILSPVYSPGRAQHFALAGFMDLNKDGLSDRATVRDMIRMNGGVIDAEVADDGTPIGEINSGTNFLVKGDRATDKTVTEAVMNGIQAIEKQADTYAVRRMSLADLVVQMGYQSPDRVVNLDKNARAEDFRPRFPNGVQPRAPSPVKPFPERPADDETTKKKSAY